jgi:Na+-driven multidrug efflux pump
VTAVGITQRILEVYFAVFMAIGVGSTALIARHIGANQIQRARQVAKQSVLLASWVGIAFRMATLFFAEPILRVMGAEPAVLHQGAIYLRVVAVPSLIISLMFILGSLLRGAGDTMSPMKAGLWMNGVHIALDYPLIFGLGPLPGFGIAGAAAATVLAGVFGVWLLIRYLRRSPTRLGQEWPQGWSPNRPVLRSITGIPGSPGFVHGTNRPTLSKAFGTSIWPFGITPTGSTTAFTWIVGISKRVGTKPTESFLFSVVSRCSRTAVRSVPGLVSAAVPGLVSGFASGGF